MQIARLKTDLVLNSTSHKIRLRCNFTAWIGDTALRKVFMFFEFVLLSHCRLGFTVISAMSSSKAFTIVRLGIPARIALANVRCESFTSIFGT